MKRTKRIIALLLKFGTLISAAGFIGSTLIQIYARFFMESAPSWTEEAARFFFIYAMSFAAGLAMKDKYYVHLDLVYDKLKENQKKVLDLNISIIVFMMFLIMSIFSIEFIVLGIPENSPSLGISMSIAFASVLVMALSIGVFAFFDMLKNLKKLL